MKTKIATLALIAMTILSCNSSKNTQIETTNTNSENPNSSVVNSNLENTQWTLVTLEGHEVHKLNDDDQEIQFTLNPDGNRVNGFSGCNTFMGTYTLSEGNKIKFSKMASTRRACPEAAIKESELINVFEMADTYVIAEGQLRLKVGNREALAYFKPTEMKGEPITEKYWKLITFEGQPVKMEKNQEREIYFILKTQDNNVTGFAGCNNFNGTYTLEKGNRIRFNQMLSTLKACPDVNVNESEFLKVFELTDNYTIKDDKLSLNVGRRAPLAVFEAVYLD